MSKDNSTTIKITLTDTQVDVEMDVGTDADQPEALSLCHHVMAAIRKFNAESSLPSTRR